jgi:hypothetical protein
MAARRTTFGKLERDRTKKAKAAAKRERRQDRSSEPSEPEEPAPSAPTGARLSEAEVMDRLRILHDRFDDGAIPFEDFEEQKAALLAHLAVD